MKKEKEQRQDAAREGDSTELNTLGGKWRRSFSPSIPGHRKGQVEQLQNWVTSKVPAWFLLVSLELSYHSKFI